MDWKVGKSDVYIRFPTSDGGSAWVNVSEIVSFCDATDGESYVSLKNGGTIRLGATADDAMELVRKAYKELAETRGKS
jgi:urocanate hydratase